jgi:hypothetical protein
MNIFVLQVRELENELANEKKAARDTMFGMIKSLWNRDIAWRRPVAGNLY